MTNTAEVTIQRLLENFVKAEKDGNLSPLGTLATTITWGGRQYKVLVVRKRWGDDSFEIHLTKIKIPFIKRVKIGGRQWQ